MNTPKVDIRKVTDSFAVSPQIQPGDVEALKEAGYTTLVCNRPDNEDTGQPVFDSIAERAQSLGMDVHHIPITAGMLGPHHIEQTAAVIDGAEGKVFAYCRSGTRSVMLWALQEVTKRPRDEVVALAAAAGYDLSQQL
jgi:uncharacterized protein (TIGR01244 family)